MIRMHAVGAAVRLFPARPRRSAISSFRTQPLPRITAKWQRNRISGQLELTWQLSSHGLADGEIAENSRPGFRSHRSRRPAVDRRSRSARRERVHREPTTCLGVRS
jgi:hypothetical protein